YGRLFRPGAGRAGNGVWLSEAGYAHQGLLQRALEGCGHSGDTNGRSGSRTGGSPGRPGGTVADRVPDAGVAAIRALAASLATRGSRHGFRASALPATRLISMPPEAPEYDSLLIDRVRRAEPDAWDELIARF